MPQSRLSVRKIREVLRLSATGLSARQIAMVASTARSTAERDLESFLAELTHLGLTKDSN